MYLLQERFQNELDILGSLFGVEQVRARLPRLNAIHTYTEAKWLEYASHLPERRVDYLLISEAPPWSTSGCHRTPKTGQRGTG